MRSRPSSLPLLSTVMPFQFRFAPLLSLQRNHREEARAEVGKAQTAIARIDQQAAQLHQQRGELQTAAQSSRVGAVSVDQMLAHGRYDALLLTDLRALRETRAQLEQELARRQAILVQAETEVKRYERLEESERRAYESERQKRQQALLDEAASIRYLRERRTR